MRLGVALLLLAAAAASAAVIQDVEVVVASGAVGEAPPRDCVAARVCLARTPGAAVLLNALEEQSISPSSPALTRWTRAPEGDAALREALASPATYAGSNDTTSPMAELGPMADLLGTPLIVVLPEDGAALVLTFSQWEDGANATGLAYRRSQLVTAENSSAIFELPTTTSTSTATSTTELPIPGTVDPTVTNPGELTEPPAFFAETRFRFFDIESWNIERLGFVSAAVGEFLGVETRDVFSQQSGSDPRDVLVSVKYGSAETALDAQNSMSAPGVLAQRFGKYALGRYSPVVNGEPVGNPTGGTGTGDSDDDDDSLTGLGPATTEYYAIAGLVCLVLVCVAAAFIYRARKRRRRETISRRPIVAESFYGPADGPMEIVELDVADGSELDFPPPVTRPGHNQHMTFGRGDDASSDNSDGGDDGDALAASPTSPSRHPFRPAVLTMTGERPSFQPARLVTEDDNFDGGAESTIDFWAQPQQPPPESRLTSFAQDAAPAAAVAATAFSRGSLLEEDDDFELPPPPAHDALASEDVAPPPWESNPSWEVFPAEPVAAPLPATAASIPGFQSFASAALETGRWYIAKSRYVARDDDELGFSKGARIFVLTEDDDGWWYARLEDGSAQGYVPAPYLRPAEDQGESHV